MAFFRFTRDTRGYEHFYLVEPVTNRRGKSRQRVLYWYRTPPNVRVGREPFDADVRRALEAQNPGVTFDWRKIVDAPIPSADAEKWRERRRIERAEKASRQAVESEEKDQGGEDRAADEGELPVEPAVADATQILEQRGEPAPLPVEVSAERIPDVAPAGPSPISGEGVRRKRRRRRGGRSHRADGAGHGLAASGPGPDPSAPPADPSPEVFETGDSIGDSPTVAEPLDPTGD